ncbi:PP2C family protein-serine/threonine phosphatase [Streptomyces sp. NPDC046862]|uniref:PP2C family protein-serine/threonine phosphatase n=1 Tax=Streptomyces sp. NPDC046862 TaxID=3154603 RepID=UPI0034546849
MFRFRAARAGARFVSGAMIFAVGTGLMLHLGHVLFRELRQVRRSAGTAQGALLRPLPARIDGLATAAAQLSADRGAAVGGDLYDVIATEHGVRVVIGDVRGHGIGAVGTVAAVLGCFREAVHDEVELAGVLRRLDSALARHLRRQATTGPDADTTVIEDFVTVLLLEIRRDGELRALNCGHPWPYLLGEGRAQPLTGADPLPPLGLFPLPSELPLVDCGRLRPGEALFLHTDGVTDARDDHGGFFPLPTALAEAVRDRPSSPQSVLRAVFTQLLRHTRGRPADDVAMLVLCNDRRPSHAPVGARGTARPATTNRQPTTNL